MLRRAASTLAPRLRLAQHGAPPSTSGPYSQTPIGILRSLHARGFTANTPAWKEKDGGDETDGAAGRRKRAEEVAATNVNRFSSPLFSHVELEKDDKLCCVCMERVKSVLFEPCNHVSVCEGCSAQMAECPLCKCTPTRKVRVYL